VVQARIELMVWVLLAVAFTAGICATLFGHNWSPPPL
jgi:hypothetical protein